MKKVFILIPIFFLLCGCEIANFKVLRLDNPLDIAIALKKELENEKNDIIFLDDDINSDEIFDNLEAIYPYAFGMEFVYYPFGITKISVEIENEIQQNHAKDFAKKIAQNQVEGINDDVEKLRILHDYLVKNCKYDIEIAEKNETKGIEPAFTAYGALVDGKAVCSGYARAYMMMCNSVGLDVFYISDESMDHSWNAVVIDNKIYYIDCTFDDPVPDQGEGILTDYFFKTESEFLNSHEWDISFYNNLMLNSTR